MRRPLVQPVAVIFLCALALSSCASNEKKTNMAPDWVQEKQQISSSIEKLRDDQTQSDLARQQQASAMTDILNRIGELEKLNQAQQNQFVTLSARVERLHRKKVVEAAKPEPEKQEIIEKPEPKQRTTQVKALPPVVAIPAPLPAPVPKVDTAAMAEAEKNAYTSAYLALKSGRYDEAANGFNKQLDLYPNGEYADQAWYWLGETRYAQNTTDRALNAFKYVADHYPDSVKHAAALFKLGQISESQNHFQQSALYYKRLIRDHADSSLAEQAREALGRTQATPDIAPEN